jgi:hypothetical protein
MSGYQPVYRSILDSTIARDHVARHVLEDLLKLADYRTGIVDMTIDAIARRTNVPEELVRHGIEELEKPDPDSRCKLEGGRRIVRLDPERAWGWRVVTYLDHQEEIKREGNRRRQADYKDRKRGGKRGLPGRPKKPVTEGALARPLPPAPAATALGVVAYTPNPVGRVQPAVGHARKPGDPFRTWTIRRQSRQK